MTGANVAAAAWNDWRGAVTGVAVPFTPSIPGQIRNQLVMLQFERLTAVAPLLFIVLMINSVAMALAVRGELPLVQQILPPAIIISVSIAHLLTWRMRRNPSGVEKTYGELRNAVFVAVGLGIVSGLWCISAFRETDQYRCVVAPVFIALSALVSANCLASVPRAAIAAMVTALTPIVIVMLFFDDLGLRAMAVMLVIIAALQSGLIISKFRETVKMLLLQTEIVALAETDPLTGLKNRRAFSQTVQERLDSGDAVSIAMIDLDGFKPVNDRHGHQAGDDVLTDVANRMIQICVSAQCIARLGGDEFAVLFESGINEEQAREEAEALRTVIALPYRVGSEALVLVTASIGAAHSPQDGTTVSGLLRIADIALYAEKAKRGSSKQLRVAARH